MGLLTDRGNSHDENQLPVISHAVTSMWRRSNEMDILSLCHTDELLSQTYEITFVPAYVIAMA